MSRCATEAALHVKRILFANKSSCLFFLGEIALFVVSDSNGKNRYTKYHICAPRSKFETASVACLQATDDYDSSF